MKLESTVTKTRRLFIRVSSDEFESIKRYADKTGTTVSAYARKRLLNEPVAAYPPKEYFELRREISGLCTNVNQIAHAVNSGIEPPNRAAREAREIAERIYDIVRGMENHGSQ
jgi:hypothetical protein